MKKNIVLQEGAYSLEELEGMVREVKERRRREKDKKAYPDRYAHFHHIYREKKTDD